MRRPSKRAQAIQSAIRPAPRARQQPAPAATAVAAIRAGSWICLICPGPIESVTYAHTHTQFQCHSAVQPSRYFHWRLTIRGLWERLSRERRRVQLLQAPPHYSAHEATNLTRGRTYTLLARSLRQRRPKASRWSVQVRARSEEQMGRARAADQRYLLANLVSDPGAGARQKPIRGYFPRVLIRAARVPPRANREASALAAANL